LCFHAFCTTQRLLAADKKLFSVDMAGVIYIPIEFLISVMNRINEIPVLRKAIQVLSALAMGDGELTTSSLARSLKIAPATCYRIIQTLEHVGWVRVLKHGRCELSVGLFPLLQHLQRHELLDQQVLAALQELTATTGITSKVSIRERNDSVTVLRVASKEPMALAVHLGSRFHLTLGATGSVLLSGLEEAQIEQVIKAAPASCWQLQNPANVWDRIKEARQHTAVMDTGTFRPDIFGVSAPLLAADGKVQGALTLTGLRHGHNEFQLNEWRGLVVQKAAELNQFTMLKIQKDAGNSVVYENY
jgi:DNA-binding IclR family transcriptional regulator